MSLTAAALPDLPALLIIVGICFAGGFVQLACGFGFSVVVTGVLTQLLPNFGEAAALANLLMLFVSVFYALRLRKNIRWKVLLWPVIGFLPMSVLMTYVLDITSGARLRTGLGVGLILLSVYLIFLQKRFSVRQTPASGIIVGAVAGVLGGPFCMAGAPMALYLLSTGNKKEYLVTSQGFFAVTTVCSAVMHSTFGFFTCSVLYLCLQHSCRGDRFPVGQAGVQPRQSDRAEADDLRLHAVQWHLSHPVLTPFGTTERKVDFMRHAYYDYNREQLLAAPKIPMEVMEDKPTVFRAIAREMADTIKAKNTAEETTVFICPVGPVGQYPYFVEMVNEERISLKNCWFINMDEYLGDDMQWIPMDHPLSFRGFMERTVYSKIDPELNVPVDHRVFPDPNRVDYIPALIEKLGGVDVCFGGIGINGHLAFNEADPTLSCEQFKQLKTRVLPISPETRAANAIGDFGGRLEDMPVWCVTIGFNEIYNSRKIRLGIFRDWHRAVARRCGYGEKTANFPVSMLAEHPDAMIRMTEFVANLED